MAKRTLTRREALRVVTAGAALAPSLLTASGASAGAPSAGGDTPAGSAGTTDGPVPKPLYGLFYDTEQFETARRRIAAEPDARRFRDHTLEVADSWLARLDDWIRQIMPPPGSRFAIGKAGCPACGKAWEDFGGGGLASLDRPLELKCPQCGQVFDLAHPSGGPYADTGMGVLMHGRRYWLRGVWNAFVTNSMWRAAAAGGSAVVALGDAYALTGDDRYARKLIVIVDALATLSPTTKGIRDYVNSPDSDEGRIHLGTSGFFRAQPNLACALDLVVGHPAFRERSPTNPKIGRIHDNVRYGLFDEYLFQPIDVRGGRLSTLHNHEADSVRALLVDGLLWAQADHVRWAATDIQAFLDNTVDRDGQYYETSFNYTSFTRNLHMSMVEMLARYDPARYPADARMPRREELAYGGNFFNHPGLARLILESPARLSVLGRPPSYGDVHPSAIVRRQAGRPYDANLYLHAHRFLRYTTDPVIRAQAAAVVAETEPFAREVKRRSNATSYAWPLYFGIDEGPAPAAAAAAKPPAGLHEETRSDLYNLTGVAILRSGGSGETRRAALLRAGMTMPHGHDDALGLLLYAQGRELSGDVGYGDTANHEYAGWATRAVAHNCVVVNQDASWHDRFRIGPGGAVVRFFDGGLGDAGSGAAAAAAPGVSWFEAAHPALFSKTDGVRDYRRAVFQIDLGPDSAYWIDLFDVDGGRTHDYSFHAAPLGDTGSFIVDGAPPAARPDAWTLAGLDPKWRNAAWNAPGKSWGERMTVSGVIGPLPGLNDGVPESDLTWLPTPGNGYGFLYDLKAAATADSWSATWRWDDKGDRYALRLTLLPEKPLLVTTATGPNLTNEAKMRWVVARSGDPAGRKDVRTRFAAVIESFGGGGEPRVTGADPLRAADGAVAGVRVRSAGGRDDVLLDARRGGAAPSAAALADAGIATAPDAGFALVRRTPAGLESICLSGGGRRGVVTKEGVGMRFADSDGGAWEGRITAVDEDAGAFRTQPALPRSAAGGLLVVSNPAYAHVSTYRVAASDPATGEIRPLDSGIVLGRAQVAAERKGGFVSTSPLVYGREYDTDTRYLTGKQVRFGSGATARIAAMPGMKDIDLTRSSAPPREGEPFVICDVQPGDTVRLEASASLVHDAATEVWTLRAELPVAIAFPAPMQAGTVAADGQVAWRDATATSFTLGADDLAAGIVRFRPAAKPPRLPKP